MASPKKRLRPIYMVVRRLIDPDTGALVGALVPSSDIDSRLMRQKRIRVGQEVRADLKRPRNSKYHRLVHVLGMMMIEHVEAFASMDTHEAIKRLQRESGICCEEQEIEVPGFGKLVVKVAQSIAFDEMEEGEFRRLYEGICDFVGEKYWPGLDADKIEEIVGVMPQYRSVA